MKILITGFDPFGGEKYNPAYEAVKLLPDKIGNLEVIKLEIPTVFKKGYEKVEKAIKEHNPDFVLCIGQAGGRSCISIEKSAINLIEARIPDNEGNQPFNQKIQPDGNTAYFSNLPVKSMVENVRKNGIPSHLSYTAGTYVCNEVMYNLLYSIDKNHPDIKGGFIHVPYTLKQAVDKPDGTASWSEETISKGIMYAVQAIESDEKDDISLGTTH